MTMKIPLVLACGALLLLMMAAPAWADLEAVGVPAEGNSWSHAFGLTDACDLIAVRLSFGAPFESPTLFDFDTPGWDTLVEKDPPIPLLASAAGPTTADLSFRVRFWGNWWLPSTFDFVAFSGDSIVKKAYVIWTGGGFLGKWVILKDSHWNPTRADVSPPDVVPAPAALVLGAIGLGLVGWRMRRHA